MTETRRHPRAAPVVELLMGLRQPAPPARPEHNNPVPVEEFDRERLGIAAKE
jgi:hypothetical protein